MDKLTTDNDDLWTSIAKMLKQPASTTTKPAATTGLLGGASGWHSISIPQTNAPNPGPRNTHVGLQERLQNISQQNPMAQQQQLIAKQNQLNDFSKFDPLAQQKALAKPEYRWAEAVSAAEDAQKAYWLSQRR